MGRWFPRVVSYAACLIAGAAFLLGGCQSSGNLAKESKPVVYGIDNRTDVYAYPSTSVFSTRAYGSNVALIGAGDIDASNPDDVQFTSQTLQQYFDLCSTERFLQQPTAAFCSGTLIDHDLVLTAGHCVSSASDCASTRLVFNYLMADANNLATVKAQNDVFSCAEIVAHEYTNSVDFTVLRLDRSATPMHTPAPVAWAATPLTNGSGLVVIGSGSGLPTKIDHGGSVRDNRSGTLDYFIANLDTFGGNSGSGVYDSAGKVVGILVRGETDYVANGSCNVVNVCAEDGCGGEDSTYAFRAVNALCASGAPSNLCPCGDGVCDAAGGETSATCCADCGCTGSDVCFRNICSPDPGEGDTCANAVPIAGTGSYQLAGTTATALPGYLGSCGSSTAPERVYTFTVTSPTTLDAQVSGFDTVLHLRTDCESAASEIACDDDSTPPGNSGSRILKGLDPGTYYLFVDGYSDNSGAFTLSVNFSEPQEGDTCATATAIPASGTQTINGDTSSANPDYAASCASSDAPDLVYSFTLTAPQTDVTATSSGLSGFDTVLYLRDSCDSSVPDLACNDDNTPPGDYGSQIQARLPAGTYYLIVDGYSTDAGAFTLTVDFAEVDVCTTNAQCDDGNACNGAETCANSVCQEGTPPTCDDGNVCTDDSCVPATGCVYVNNTAACDDGNACTTADTCAGGACVGGQAPNCNDGNVCTDDSCNPVSGCVNANNTASCDDGDACTTADTCSNGQCTGTQACGDTVTIITAEWKSKGSELKVEATSSNAPAANLSIYRSDGTTKVGDMSYDRKKNLYKFRRKNIAQPQTIIVKSDLGGSDTATVIQR